VLAVLSLTPATDDAHVQMSSCCWGLKEGSSPSGWCFSRVTGLVWFLGLVWWLVGMLCSLAACKGVALQPATKLPLLLLCKMPHL
jgi:hypothetical protein